MSVQLQDRALCLLRRKLVRLERRIEKCVMPIIAPVCGAPIMFLILLMRSGQERTGQACTQMEIWHGTGLNLMELDESNWRDRPTLHTGFSSKESLIPS